jgi:alkylation response protein AidB-like acyl-CoA dehydrogenase
MDFDLSDDQRLLKESAARYVQSRCSFTQWQRWRLAGEQPGEQLWSALAEMGWLALPFTAADGGLDGGPVETMLLLEALGRGLVAAPYLQSVVHAGALLGASRPGPARTARIAALIGGHSRPALACDEAASRYARDLVEATAEPQGDGWCLRGDKCVVLGGDGAQAFIVSACTPQGLALFWVEAAAAGLSRCVYPLVDGGRGADLRLDGVVVDDDARLCAPGEAWGMLKAADGLAIAGIGAEAMGLVDLLLAETVAYTRGRRQFGQPLAGFQVLRHRMVDMFMQAEQLRSLVLLATIRLAEGHGDHAASVTASALSALKVQVGRVGRFVSQQAVQLHGGMGMTDEIVVGHAFKRLLALDAQLGNADHHLRQFAAQRA